jgi:wobble nucleotide-excising tRNase
MKTLKVYLENCYGIKKLDTSFNFEQHGRVFAIYAPNGVMKTSFANTFKDVSQGSASSDRIWKDSTTTRVIEDENSASIQQTNVFVIEPYNEKFKSDRIQHFL